ncbi:MAG TPA: hypothetical protein ENI76_10065 [Ignavibacteria bacterium]|nr:hypothetical protein [Ignavibacteria bacterium]
MDIEKLTRHSSEAEPTLVDISGQVSTIFNGQVDDFVPDTNRIYNVLMDALKLIPEDKPYRGPEKYNSGGLSYKNSFTGEVDNFFGEESISEKGKEIYKARYIGGSVDIKEE